MESKVILLDTGILIEFFRKKNKAKSILYQLSLQPFEFKVAAISYYEILLGSNDSQKDFWGQFFDRIQVLPFDSVAAGIAAEIYQQLKSENQLIDIADILIGSIAISNQISLATLNSKHFIRINKLKLVDLSFSKKP